MVAANTVMSRLLKTTDLLPCDAELFDKVASTLPWVHASKWASGKDYAQLLLYHPTRPDPRPFFKMTYETYHGDNPDNHDRTLKRQPAQNAMGTQILRAAYLSRLYGDDHHTEYLGKIVQAYFKHNWRARAKVFADYSEDPKLNPLLRLLKERAVTRSRMALMRFSKMVLGQVELRSTSLRQCKTATIAMHKSLPQASVLPNQSSLQVGHKDWSSSNAVQVLKATEVTATAWLSKRPRGYRVV